MHFADAMHDIVIDYEYMPSAISEIPSEYHEFLVSWTVINLIEIPQADAPDYAEMLRVKNLHESVIKMVEGDIKRTFKQSSGPTQIKNVWAGYDN